MRMINRTLLQISCLLVIAATCAFLLGSCRTGNPGKKVIVLGMDGMDPVLLARFVKKGVMPNFANFMESGDYLPLETSMPPQSPVAWSNFITGMNSGGHRIFDFLHRDTETMLPKSSMSEAEAATREVTLGDWVLPLSSGSVKSLREGRAFWELLEEKDIPVRIFKIPVNFPPVETRGPSLSGMGTPDLTGSMGSFSYFTDAPPKNAREVTGGEVYEVAVVGNKAICKLHGPKNSFRTDAPESIIEFEVYPDPENAAALIHIQDQTILLKEGEWSDWVHIEFEMVPYLVGVKGICRFYLKQVRPDFKLYVTPLNIDPEDPAMPVSSPESYSRDLARAVGLFYTQGMPEDTKALSHGIFSDADYVGQSHLVLEERLKMFDYELSRFKSGFMFFYFSSTDLNCHMMWRTWDKKHPAYTRESEKFGEHLEVIYRAMDSVVGKAMEKVDENTTLIVMSDHGFAPYRRSVNLNAWLKKNGYLEVRNQSARGTPRDEFLLNIDWNRTKAYALGFNALYLNLQGREKKGIVSPGEEADKLVKQIKRKLLNFKDPETGKKIIRHAYEGKRFYSGPYVDDAPDLLVGYIRGYRASDETALGATPWELIEDNKEKWSGDHCMDYILVPGILLSNKKVQMRKPSLCDLTVSILAEFDVDPLPEMIGNNIF